MVLVREIRAYIFLMCSVFCDASFHFVSGFRFMSSNFTVLGCVLFYLAGKADNLSWAEEIQPKLSRYVTV